MPEGLTLNGLSLNNGTTHFLTELQLPIPAKKPEWVEGADADGAMLMRDPLVENGTLVAKVDIFRTTKDLANASIGAIIDELEEADRNPAGIPVVWTPVSGTKSLTFYALSGEVTELPMDGKAVDSNVPTITITLKCRPGGYGALVTGPSQTTTGPLVELNVPDVTGDMPTDEAYVVITDMSSQARWRAEWGAEWLHYNSGSPWSVFIDADSLTVSGYAGVVTTATGSYDTGGGSGTVRGTLFETWAAIASTGSQPHIGTFRVKARIGNGNSADASARFRAAWRVGDGSFAFNDSVTVSAGVVGTWQEVDLGLVTIPRASAGTQSWELRFDGQYVSGALTDWYLDYLIFIPVSAGYGVALGESTPQPGVVTVYDRFTGGAGALSGDAVPTGGTWATSGVSGTDFQASGSPNYNVTRTAGTEALWAGRFAVAGATNYAAVTVNLTGAGYNVAGSDRGISGIIVRWVDASNWFAVFTNPGWSFGDPTLAPFNHALMAVKNVAGTKTLLAYADSTVPSTVGGTGISFEWEGTASANGNFSATLTSSHVASLAISGYDAVLATGGAVASGKPGFYSERTGGSVTYTFDDFFMSSIPALVPAVYSGRTLEVASAETRRQNSGGTIYGRPHSYRGSRFVLNPEGSAGRTTRVVALAREHVDSREVNVSTQIGRQLKAQVFYRPRFSTVPR